uniref:Uncharacterized protein n=1 Tax=Octopus bimaculoides TaxID=37653 RepID=A0A0L8IFF1_OCTBM
MYIWKLHLSSTISLADNIITTLQTLKKNTHVRSSICQYNCHIFINFLMLPALDKLTVTSLIVYSFFYFQIKVHS